MTGVALIAGAIGLALVVSIARLFTGIAKARGRMQQGAPRARFHAAVDAGLSDYAALKPYVVEREDGAVDVDCLDLQLRFEGSAERCSAFGRISAYDRWMPIDRVLDDGVHGPLSVAQQSARIGAAADRLQSRLLVASAER